MVGDCKRIQATVIKYRKHLVLVGSSEGQEYQDSIATGVVN